MFSATGEKIIIKNVPNTGPTRIYKARVYNVYIRYVMYIVYVRVN